MKIIEGFKLRPLGREFIVTGEGLAQVKFNKMAALNASAAYLWNEVEGKEFSVDDLTDLLCAKYDVEREVAAADAAKLAQSLIEAGVVSE